MRRVLFLACALAVAMLVLSEERTDQIAGYPKIYDGDGLVFGKVEVRLTGIDAPEFADRHQTPKRWEDQPGTEGAQNALAGLVGQRRVVCTTTGRGHYGRPFGRCAVYHGDAWIDINTWMIEQGWAWSYRRTEPLRELENEAPKSLTEKKLGGISLL